MLKKHLPLIALLIAAVMVAAQCGAPPAATSSDAQIKVMEPWARPSPMVTGNGAVYMQLMNEGGSDDALLSAETDALADHEGCDEAGDAGIDMNDRAAGEIKDAVIAEKTAAPDPMGDRAIDEDQPGRDEPQQCGELHAVGEGAADQRRRDDREGELEHHEQHLGDRAGQRIDPDAGQHQDHEYGIAFKGFGEFIGCFGLAVP